MNCFFNLYFDTIHSDVEFGDVNMEHLKHDLIAFVVEGELQCSVYN